MSAKAICLSLESDCTSGICLNTWTQLRGFTPQKTLNSSAHNVLMSLPPPTVPTQTNHTIYNHNEPSYCSGRQILPHHILTHLISTVFNKKPFSVCLKIASQVSKEIWSSSHLSVEAKILEHSNYLQIYYLFLYLLNKGVEILAVTADTYLSWLQMWNGLSSCSQTDTVSPKLSCFILCKTG